MISPKIISQKGMIKMRKTNYMSEKEEALNMKENIKAGTGIMSEKIEELCRGYRNPFQKSSYQEEKYMINEILKKYKYSQDEKKGYSSKYVLELSNLLGSKNKNFPKERLELYNNRINKKSDTFIKYDIDNYLLQKKNSEQLKKSIQTLKKGMTNKKKVKTFMTNIFSNVPNNKTSLHFYEKGFSNKNKNRPKLFSLNNSLANTKKKFEFKNKEQEFKFIKSIAQNEDSFDTTSLVGKEEFFVSGDREKYQEFLQKEYQFFEQPKLGELKFLIEKQKRIKLFKKQTNYKYLNYKKEDPIKTEIFRRINRGRNHFYSNIGANLKKEKNYNKKYSPFNMKGNLKGKTFFKDCQQILENIKSNLNEELC